MTVFDVIEYRTIAIGIATSVSAVPRIPRSRQNMRIRTRIS